MLEIIEREFIYISYYFMVQLRQIFVYWVAGMVIGSFISVFAQNAIHSLFGGLKDKKMGIWGVIPASLLGTLSPLCMYGTIPIAASFSRQGMRDDWLASGMSMGAAASFMITGPATKITNLGALKIVLGIRHFLIYLIYVMAFSMAAGLMVNFIL